MYVIDTNDEVQVKEFLEKKEALEKEKGEKYFDYEYNSSDICLVRVMDRLPSKDKKLVSVSNVPFLLKKGIDVNYFAFDLLRKENSDLFNVDYNEYKPLSTQYRSSIHFTLNGMVGSHMGGNWEGDNLNVVVIEPFSYHENDENIISVRGEDTYFKDSVQLSDDAVLLVGVERAEEVMDTYNGDEYNIVFYKGDKSKAIDMCLVNMGIVPESISANYISSSSTSDKLNKYIKSKGYSMDAHAYSHSNYEDDMKNLKLWDLYDNDFYDYLEQEAKECASEIEYLRFNTPDVMLDKIKDIITPEVFDKILNDYNEKMYTTGYFIPYINFVSDVFKVAYNDEYLLHEKEIEFISENDTEDFDETALKEFKAEHLKNVIKTIGLHRYKELVDNYNDVLTRAVESGKYPTNNEILNGAPFGYSAALEMESSKTL